MSSLTKGEIDLISVANLDIISNLGKLFFVLFYKQFVWLGCLEKTYFMSN